MSKEIRDEMKEALTNVFNKMNKWVIDVDNAKSLASICSAYAELDAIDETKESNALIVNRLETIANPIKL